MRKRYVTGALVLLLVMGLSGVAFAANTSTVTQTGPMNEATIDQIGDSNVADVTQRNLGFQIGARAQVKQDNSVSPTVGNIATIVQPDASDPDPAVIGAYIEQVGDNNYAHQDLVQFSQASIKQVGDENSAEQYHTGTGHYAFAEQSGSFNVITQTEDGLFNRAEAWQIGNSNSITQFQIGNHNHAYAWQSGNNNFITQNQTGDGHSSQVTQNGDNNVARVTQ